MASTVAVTGGSGKLGQHVVAHLLEQGHNVVSIDRTLPPYQFVPGARRAMSYAADTRDFGQLVACIKGADALIHLAAHPSPLGYPDTVVYSDNTIGSYNALAAAVALGINRVCLASSINAIGGAFSQNPRYDYFPVDEQHPTYAEDPYSLSKWVLEQQADAFVRRYPQLRVASLRFHMLVESLETAPAPPPALASTFFSRHLWGYTLMSDAVRACELGISADFNGHEAFYIVAPRTMSPQPSPELATSFFPETPIRGELAEHQGFFDCSKAERLLGWVHSK